MRDEKHRKNGVRLEERKARGKSAEYRNPRFDRNQEGHKSRAKAEVSESVLGRLAEVLGVCPWSDPNSRLPRHCSHPTMDRP